MPLLERVLHILLPRTCAHCREDLPAGDRGPLCAACGPLLRPILPNYCVRCGLPIEGGAHCARCAGKSFQCEAIRAVFLYDGPAQSLVVKFKYGGRPTLASPMGAWLAQAHERLSAGEALAVPPSAWSADAVVPVPLSKKRRRERGYNQAELLARELAARRGLAVLDALERTKDAPPQAGLGREERLSNLRGAYRAKEPVEGKTLLLIDDVGTTGTTLEECAKALRAAGAKSVKALVFARQPL